MVSIIPYSLGFDVGTGAVDFDTHTFGLMLMTATYAPSKTHTKQSDWTATEVSGGTGYVRKVATVSSVTRSTGTTSVAWATITWTTPNGWSARYAGIYRERGGAASANEAIAMIDFGATFTAAGGDYVLSIPTPLQIVVP